MVNSSTADSWEGGAELSPLSSILEAYRRAHTCVSLLVLNHLTSKGTLKLKQRK